MILTDQQLDDKKIELYRTFLTSIFSLAKVLSSPRFDFSPSQYKQEYFPPCPDKPTIMISNLRSAAK